MGINLTRNAALLGSTAEVLLLSFALGDRINLLTREKRRIEQESQQALADKNLELRQALAEVTKANGLKDEFLATISHKLRTPMNGIEGSLEILQQRDNPEESERTLKAAKTSANHMTLLVETLLEYSEQLAPQ